MHDDRDRPLPVAADRVMKRIGETEDRRRANTLAAGANVKWLLREDDAERAVAVSDRIAIDDDHWRATIHRFRPADGLRIALSTAEVRREVVFETPSRRGRTLALQPNPDCR